MFVCVFRPFPQSALPSDPSVEKINTPSQISTQSEGLPPAVQNGKGLILLGLAGRKPIPRFGESIAI
jgi:hypothetical protein